MTSQKYACSGYLLFILSFSHILGWRVCVYITRILSFRHILGWRVCVCITRILSFSHILGWRVCVCITRIRMRVFVEYSLTGRTAGSYPAAGRGSLIKLALINRICLKGFNFFQK